MKRFIWIFFFLDSDWGRVNKAIIRLPVAFLVWKFVSNFLILGLCESMSLFFSCSVSSSTCLLRVFLLPVSSSHSAVVSLLLPPK
jgi:hypothetical protein